MEGPDVSVVIPVYRSADTILQALDSVRRQTCGGAELLVVDDASPDDTVRRVEAWMASDGAGVPTRLLRQPRNGGPAAARNAGIQAAERPWVAFLDADDAWLPRRLERQFSVAADHPGTGLLCGLTLPLDEHSPGWAGEDDDSGGTPRPLAIIDFVAHNPVATSTVLVRRDVVLAAGLFDVQFRGPEDYDLWMRIARRTACLLLPEALSLYRRTPGSLSMDERGFLPEVLRVLDKAFAPGGALADHRAWRHTAMAEQYTSASWMAYNRGARGAALRYLLAAWWLCPGMMDSERRRDRRLRLKLLGRYVAGPREC